MGRMALEGMIEANPDRVAVLMWHLRANHYPPVNQVFIPVCEEAIEACSEGKGGLLIEMPNGITKSARKMVEGLHLEQFCALSPIGEEDY